MVKQYFAPFVIFMFFSTTVVEGQGRKPHPKEEGLKPVVETLLSDLADASVTVGSRGLVAEYRVQEFQVHTVMRDGSISETAHAERGPKKDGFLLRVIVNPDLRYPGPILLSPEGYGLVHHPYWVTQVREIRLPESDEYVWVTLATGFAADTKLMHELQESIYAYMTSK